VFVDLFKIIVKG